MTAQEKKKKQYQLEALQARKAKADSLGPEVIARTREKYDGICAEIAALQDELAADEGGPMAELEAVIFEALSWNWPDGDPLGRCEMVAPDLARRVVTLNRGMTAAFNQGQLARMSDMVVSFRKVLKEMLDAVTAAPAQMEFFTEVYDATPFDE